MHYFTIWNEPNHRNFLKPTSRGPAVYRKLVDDGAAADPPQRARAAAQIFVGELAPVGRAPIAMGPKAFLRKWLCLNRRLRRTSSGSGCRSFKRIDADGFAHHPYGPDRARAAQARRDQHARDPARSRRTSTGRASARRFTRKLDIYNTEFGLQSNPPDRIVSTSLSRQAALINEKEEYAYRYSRLKSHSQYLLFDDPARPGSLRTKWSGFQTGLRFASGRPKPSYNAYRFPIVVKKRRPRRVRVGPRAPGHGPAVRAHAAQGRQLRPAHQDRSARLLRRAAAHPGQLPVPGLQRAGRRARNEPHRPAVRRAGLAALAVGAALALVGLRRTDDSGPRRGRSGRCSRTTTRWCARARRSESGRSTSCASLGVDTLRVGIKWNEAAPRRGCIHRLV